VGVSASPHGGKGVAGGGRASGGRGGRGAGWVQGAAAAGGFSPLPVLGRGGLLMAPGCLPPGWGFGGPSV